MSTIALIRHGPSAHVHTGWIDSAGFQKWRDAYEAAGIRPGETVPDFLTEKLKDAKLFVSSDAPRAVESARALSPGHEVTISPLLRELDLEGPHFGRLRLPLGAWAVAVGLRSLSLQLRGRYPSPHERTRIDEAMEWLRGLAVQHGFVAAVTHASFRRQLALRLMTGGWRPLPGEQTMSHWSVWAFGAPKPE